MKNVQRASVILLLSAAFVAMPLHAQVITDYAGHFSSATGVGVYGRGDTSNSSSTNNEGGYFLGGKGLYARGTDSAGESGYGARIYSDNYRGMYAEGASGYYAAYFGGDTGINVSGVVTRLSADQSMVVNLGESSIEPGDLVAMVGTTSSPDSGQPMLGVAKLDASNRNAVIGVAKEAILDRVVALADGSERVDFGPTAGSAGPKSYLVIVTGGLAPAVNLSSLALVSNGKVGDKIALTEPIDGKVA